MVTKKYKIQQLQSDETLLTLHPETDASIVKVDTSKTGTTATNVEDALKELKDTIVSAAGGGVTGVKGSAETQYRKGQVNITKENIGLDKVNNVSITENQVTQIGTNKTDIDNLKLKVGNLSGAFTFQGVLNNISNLPLPSIENKGFVYIIDNKEYVSDSTRWVELGDESSFILKTTYESHLQAQLEKDNAQEKEIADIKNGSTVVGKAQQDSDGNVIKDTYQKKALSTPINIEGNSRATVEEAISGLNSYIDSVAGVNEAQDSKINNVKDDIANIKDGTTIVGKANRDSAGNVIHQTYVQASKLKTINGESIVGTGDIKTKLEDSGVVAGTYSVVKVNSKGIVTMGAHLIEVGVVNQVTPSDNLAVGGIFFQEI